MERDEKYQISPTLRFTLCFNSVLDIEVICHTLIKEIFLKQKLKKSDYS